ncbi:SDR family oxidoreductase [Saccharibacillus alkalitolerans]|uniref:SDR family oxidoreductase n=1 Tax=Saccharibacillus alkalitolerans TaxID=2705290 RepID=A0ABX0F059_9BACL|nr:SDR family oxidoreductase [Saccharibacillus alkalitolerans]NGZ74391.1 SDR family oxidoreductase [Saccharibacillus alkalitolerans]
MDTGLKGKSVFVAAASKGLGRAAALEFAREGANVTIASRSAEHLSEAKRAIGEATGTAVNTVVMDAGKEEDVRRAIGEAAEALGGLDVLVCNAGGPPGGRFDDFSDRDWQAAYELNLLGTIRMIREALPHMRRSGGGRIVTLTSTSIKQPIDGLILSNVFRAGVNALTKTLAAELAPDGILVNTVAPGRIATGRIRELDEANAKKSGRPLQEIQAENERSIPLGRLGQPDEFGRAVVFYGSFANTYATGQAILVDGGAIKAL